MRTEKEEKEEEEMNTSLNSLNHETLSFSGKRGKGAIMKYEVAKVSA